MTCRILMNNCFARLSSNSKSAASLFWKETTKWQNLVEASATYVTLATSRGPKHSRHELAENKAFAGSTDFPRWPKAYSSYSHLTWQNCVTNNSLSTQLLHADRQHQRCCCYSTEPSREGSGSTASTQAVGGDSAGAQLSQRERLKRAVKEYGSTVIVFHITISLASLGGFYLAVSSGIDMVGILKSLGVGETILQSKLATGTGTFVVAYAVHKVFAPVRIGITLTATPFIVRYLRSKGVLKPPKPKA